MYRHILVIILYLNTVILILCSVGWMSRNTVRPTFDLSTLRSINPPPSSILLYFYKQGTVMCTRLSDYRNSYAHYTHYVLSITMIVCAYGKSTSPRILVPGCTKSWKAVLDYKYNTSTHNDYVRNVSSLLVYGLRLWGVHIHVLYNVQSTWMRAGGGVAII